jgi:hypothetical protein
LNDLAAGKAIPMLDRVAGPVRIIRPEDYRPAPTLRPDMTPPVAAKEPTMTTPRTCPHPGCTAPLPADNPRARYCAEHSKPKWQQWRWSQKKAGGKAPAPRAPAAAKPPAGLPELVIPRREALECHAASTPGGPEFVLRREGGAPLRLDYAEAAALMGWLQDAFRALKAQA